MFIKKRDGREVEFDSSKIVAAIRKANAECEIHSQISNARINAIAEDVRDLIANRIFISGEEITVEDIQDAVEKTLFEYGAYVVGKRYMTYRFGRALLRPDSFDKENLLLLDNENEDAKVENSNKNTDIISTQRDYMAGNVSKRLCEKVLFPKDLWEAHKNGLIHIHDTDYISGREYNCCLINLEDMLWNGTRISNVPIYRPHSFRTACTVTTQIVAQVASSQYGGQTFSLSHLAPFVDISRKKIKERLMNKIAAMDITVSEDKLNKLVETELIEEIEDGVQTIQYQLITLQTTNGQAPFISVFMYIDEVPEGQLRDDLVLIIKEVLKQRIAGIKDSNGLTITPAFPKLLYVLDEDNVREGTKYWDVTELAIECTVKRMVPDYISAKKMREIKGEVYGPMGCRSFLTVEDSIRNSDGSHKIYGRFNQGVCTINLVDAACSSGRDETKFWSILDERLEMCHRVLQIRHKRLLGTVSDVAPILWQDGAIARLKPGEKIDKLLYGGYSTISLGYAGLYECTYYMTGASHTGAGKDFALRVMKYLNEKCAEWRAAENIGYSVYGTPLESTTGKFANCLQKRFGIIPEVTEHLYVTNSYHVNVREKIDAFTKLKFESEFQELSPGGAISYIELSSLMKNIEAATSVIQYIYDTIMYAELNTKIDVCYACGYEGEITLKSLGKGKFEWRCPNCGNTDQKKMLVTRRTCGYLGQNWWSPGRLSDIHDRVLHL